MNQQQFYINNNKEPANTGWQRTKSVFATPGTLEVVSSPHTLPHIARKTSYMYQYI